MPHSFGYRARTRKTFRREFRRNGQLPTSTYLRIFKLGQIVDVVGTGYQQKVHNFTYVRRVDIIRVCPTSNTTEKLVLCGTSLLALLVLSSTSVFATESSRRESTLELNTQSTPDVMRILRRELLRLMLSARLEEVRISLWSNTKTRRACYEAFSPWTPRSWPLRFTQQRKSCRNRHSPTLCSFGLRHFKNKLAYLGIWATTFPIVL